VARQAIEYGEERRRAGAVEYLDNILTGTLRKKLVPLLEESPSDSFSSIGIGAVRQATRGVEQVVLRLINDADPVLSAVAIYYAWQQKLSNLAEELERMIATRDARDLYVFEAVSWVMAALRMPESRSRMLWLDPLPAVELAARLRRLPLFGTVTIDELFRISGAGRQQRFEPGRLLCQETLVPESVQFLLDGRVTMRGLSGNQQEIKAPAALGFQEVLEGRPMGATARTSETAVCLTLSSEEIHALLAENTGLVPGLFRMLCSDLDRSSRLVVKGTPPKQPLMVANGRLKPVEKGLVLSSIPVFADVSAEEIVALAAVASELPLETGTQLFAEQDPPGLYALISGELLIRSSEKESPFRVGASDIVGIYETLAGLPFEHSASVTRPGYALRVDRDDLFDVLSQRPGLLHHIFSALFRSQAARRSSLQ